MSRKPFRRATDAERRSDLIAAMLECIAEGGLQSATVREVAERAGVSGGLIRHYFETKDQLLQAAYRQTMTEMLDIGSQAASDENAAPRVRLQRFIVSCLTPPMIDPGRLALWAAFIAVARVDEAMGAIHREAYLEYRALIEKLVGDAYADAARALAPDHRRALAVQVNAVLDGLWLEGCLAGDLFENEELLKAGIQSVESITGLALSDI